MCKSICNDNTSPIILRKHGRNGMISRLWWELEYPSILNPIYSLMFLWILFGCLLSAIISKYPYRYRYINTMFWSIFVEWCMSLFTKHSHIHICYERQNRANRVSIFIFVIFYWFVWLCECAHVFFSVKGFLVMNWTIKRKQRRQELIMVQRCGVFAFSGWPIGNISFPEEKNCLHLCFM